MESYLLKEATEVDVTTFDGSEFHKDTVHGKKELKKGVTMGIRLRVYN